MKKYLALILALAINVGMHAQVTIGSDLKPAPGSLLDLKEFEGTTGITSTRGLLLPRVKLLDATVLQIAADTQNKEHIGTLIYAIPEESEEPEEDENACASIPRVESSISGIMIWTGTEWQPLLPKKEGTTDPSLPSWVHPAVKATKPDHEGNSYTYRYFGNPAHQYISFTDFVSAGGIAENYQNFGYWMTENLRSKKYASNHPGVELALVQVGDEPASLLYGYPQKFPRSKMQDDLDFKEFPSLGLLYSPGAITGAPNGKVVSAPNMQGICPDGWFLPTKSDWDGLVAYLHTPEQRAQYTTYDTQTPSMNPEISRTLTTACSDFMNPDHVNGSRGKVASEGAFGLVAVGWGMTKAATIRNSTIFEYPETPDTGSVNGLLYRAGSASTTYNSVYYSFKSQPNPIDQQMISVRCRTNKNPEL